MYFQFLANIKRRLPDINIIIISGNHDSPNRLDAPKTLLSTFGIHISSKITFNQNTLDAHPLIVGIKDKTGTVQAWCGAVPFLRPFDLPKIAVNNNEDVLIQGIRQIYKKTTKALLEKSQPNQALILTGHCCMTGSTLSDLSERKIVLGNHDALPVDIFSQDIDYVALGHLHRAQTVGGQKHIRYSGSPIPLAMNEKHYNHQVYLLELEGKTLKSCESIQTPKTVDMITLPKDEPKPLDDVIELIHQLTEKDSTHPFETYPFLELNILLEKPEPILRPTITTLLANKAVRLVKINTHHTDLYKTLAEHGNIAELKALDPESVFLKAWARHYQTPPDLSILKLFNQMLENYQKTKHVS